MTLVESLKKFLAKLGGDPTGLDNNATSAEVINAISEAYTDKEGTYVEVTPITTEGTKIATITTNNTPHDIYVPDPPAKKQIRFNIGELTYDAENYEYKVPITMLGTEEQILATLESNTKDTILFGNSVSGGGEITIEMYSISHRDDRWMINIRLKQYVKNNYFEGNIEYYFSNVKQNGQWDVPVGTGKIYGVDTDKMLYTIDNNRKIACHLPWSPYTKHLLKFFDIHEEFFGHLSNNNSVQTSLVFLDESGYANCSNSMQYPFSSYVDSSIFAGTYSKINYRDTLYIAFEKLYKNSQSDDITLKKWYYHAETTSDDDNNDIVLTRVEIT